MLHQTTLIACGSISYEGMVLIFTSLAALGISVILAIVNLVLVCCIAIKKGRIAGHAAAWLAYVGTAAVLCTGILPNSLALIIAAIAGLLSATVVHFVRLLRAFRKARSDRKSTMEDQVITASPC